MFLLMANETLPTTSLSRVWVRATLSPLWGSICFHFGPTAYAVGWMLAPLHGWKQVPGSSWASPIQISTRNRVAAPSCHTCA